jgi:hypothetical protein
MKFGEYFIPARTKTLLVNKPEYRGANLPGMSLVLAVSLFDIHPRKATGVPQNEVQIYNQLEAHHHFGTTSKMTGIVVETKGDKVFLDAGDRFYEDFTLYEWQVQNIFGQTIPEQIEKSQYRNVRSYYLSSVVEYLENEFADWVQKNCKFRELTKADIEAGYGFDGAEPGDRTLSDKGLVQFNQKQLEYMNRLEVTGFTHDFKGGLIWD